ncbi:MAG: NifB/NifX family molybdenum-iron cluster-binding protein [bacterium]
MRTALAIWNGRVSPVFDVSRQILILDIENGTVIARNRQVLDDNDPLRRAGRLADMKVETLLCGAISRCLSNLLAAYGIRIIPFIAGEAEDVISAYLAGNLPNPAMAMPGCLRRCRRLQGR